MRQRHSLGQIFLRDKQYIRRIVAAVDSWKRTILEIGPGNGQISALLALKSEKLFCVEIDKRFCAALQDKFRDNKKITVLNEDIRDFAISRLGKNAVVFGNIPYFLSTAILKRLLFYRRHIDKAYLLLQKEFARKINSRDATVKNNALSYHLGYHAGIRELFTVPAKAFRPVPKIDSVFVEIEFYRRPPFAAADEDILFSVIRAAFLNPRKKISAFLKTLTKDLSFAADGRLALDARPAELSIKDYVFIADKIKAKTPVLSKFVRTFAKKRRKNEGGKFTASPSAMED